MNDIGSPKEQLCTKGSLMEHEKIDYVELPSRDLERTKEFFSGTFNWKFTDYGPEYTAFSNEGLDGGFYKSELVASSAKGGALLVFYSKELEQTQQKIESNGGKVVKQIFSFPGGRRFHFTDPSGNEYAVWTNT